MADHTDQTSINNAGTTDEVTPISRNDDGSEFQLDGRHTQDVLLHVEFKRNKLDEALHSVS